MAVNERQTRKGLASPAHTYCLHHGRVRRNMRARVRAACVGTPLLTAFTSSPCFSGAPCHTTTVQTAAFPRLPASRGRRGGRILFCSFHLFGGATSHGSGSFRYWVLPRVRFILRLNGAYAYWRGWASACRGENPICSPPVLLPPPIHSAVPLLLLKKGAATYSRSFSVSMTALRLPSAGPVN